MYSLRTILALTACFCSWSNARDIAVMGDISDLQVQKVAAAFYDSELFGHFDFVNGPQLGAIAVVNQSSLASVDPFAQLAALPNGLATRDSIVCDSSGTPNTFGRFLEDNKARVANAAGALAASLPGGLYVYIDKVKCRENVACSVVFSVIATAAGTYTYTEVQGDVSNAIDNIHYSCSSQKGRDTNPPDGSTISVRVATSSDQNRNCNSAPTSNCRMVPPNQ